MKSIITRLFCDGLKAVDPEQLVLRRVQRAGRYLQIAAQCYDLSTFQRIYLFAIGKASIPMARAMHKLLPNEISDGLVVTNQVDRTEDLQIPVIVASHPLPNHASMTAGKILRRLALSADEKTFVLVAISGGGSALCEDSELPLQGIIDLTEQLLRSGASIQENNCLRQHLSRIKGGKLAQSIWPAQSVSLILSDVVGDELSYIASGPTVQASTLPSDALVILEKYQLAPRFSQVIAHLQRPYTAIADEVFSRVQVEVVGNTHSAVQAVQDSAKRAGYYSLVLSSTMTGEAAALAEVWAAIAESVMTNQQPHSRPLVIIGGGESTVTVKGRGKGGRNQELALAFLYSCLQRKLSTRQLCFLSASTDGIDGPTDAAGGIIMPADYHQKDLPEIGDSLADNDAYHFLQRRNALLKIGPTGTNVCDLQILLIES